MKKRLLLISLVLMLASALMLTYFAGCGVSGNNKNGTAASEGLLFRENRDGTYTVIAAGSFTGSNLVIPATYKGKPVTRIGESAFEENRGLLSVVIPEGILRIEEAAFDDCDNLERVILPDSLQYVGDGAFPFLPDESYSEYRGGKYLGNANNPYLLFARANPNESVTIHKDTKIIGSFAFNESTITSLTIPDNVLYICEAAFSEISELTEVVLPAHLKTIETFLFGYCSGLREVTIGTEVESIEKYAFGGCRELVIRYLGTVAEWNAILKDAEWQGWDPTPNAITVQCTDGIA